MHDKEIATMARAMHDRAGWNNWERTEHEWRERATAALTALCTLHPGVAALLRGEAVAVPREDVADIAGNVRGIRRMLAASPWAQETRDAE